MFNLVNCEKYQSDCSLCVNVCECFFCANFLRFVDFVADLRLRFPPPIGLRSVDEESFSNKTFTRYNIFDLWYR